MKVRVYYDGYKDRYYPQYKEWFKWHCFRELSHYQSHYLVDVGFETKNNAIKYLTMKKIEYQKEKEREAAARERDKKSGVVYEDVI